MPPIYRSIDVLASWPSRLLATSMSLAKLAVLVLLLSMIWEVVGRYLFRSSGTWSYEMSYMAFGALVLLGIGPTQRLGGHIRVDFLKETLGEKVSRAIDIVGYITLLIPCVLLTLSALLQKLADAYATGEATGQSSWNPPLWPYLAVLTLGLIIFLCQVVLDAMPRKLGAAKIDKERAE